MDPARFAALSATGGMQSRATRQFRLAARLPRTGQSIGWSCPVVAELSRVFERVGLIDVRIPCRARPRAHPGVNARASVSPQDYNPRIPRIATDFGGVL